MAGNRTELAAHLGVGELRERARARKGVDPKKTRRWQALWLFAQGQRTVQDSAATGLSVSWLAEIRRRYNADWAVSMSAGHRRRPGGTRPLLIEQQCHALAAAIEAPVPAPLGGELWSGR